MQIRYTETFYSIQGEGKNTGMPCTWLRTFGCTLECKGFGQEKPSDPSTWKESFTKEQLIDIVRLEDMPTPSYGCDSSYSWSKEFRHLAKKSEASDLASQILRLTPNGTFGGTIGHVFTGGEPLMHQRGIAELLQVWIDLNDIPAWVCFETNGTVDLQDELAEVLTLLEYLGTEVYFSISPKLLHVAGEQPEKSINYSVMSELIKHFPKSYVKMVLNTDTAAWAQADAIADTLSKLVDTPSIWVMPVGGTFEQQNDSDAASYIADQALMRSWAVSLRVHVLLWKNDQIGR